MNATNRDRSLDRLRGAAVLGMILVVSPGSWSHRPPQLDHAVWNGWAPADIVMPMFLLCVGLAIPLSSRSAAGFFPIVRRTLILLALGLVLNFLPDLTPSTLRIPGILQRIGVCYFIGASVHDLVSVKRQLDYPKSCVAYSLAILTILLANYVTMHHVRVPGPNADMIWGQGVVSAYVDQLVFGVPHLWPWAYIDSYGFRHDPDGILSTLFASSAVILGTLFAVMRQQLTDRKGWHPLALGVPLVIVGLLLDSVIPINKVIWSVSFSLFSVGVALLLLSALELSGRRLPDALFIPFDVFGSNAILAFILSSVSLAYHGVPIFAGKSAQALVFERVQTLFSDPQFASLVCALLVASLILAVLYPLHRKRIFLRL